MDRTTDLLKLKHRHDFTWGVVNKIHEIGEYNIVEYNPWKVKNSTVLVDDPDSETLNYACYINGKSIGISALSLDDALATCIAYKHEGANGRAALYFMKMLKQEG